MNYYEMVKEFHEATDLPVADKPRWVESEFELRLSLTHEEFRELQDALSMKSFIDTADALADLMYVLCGNQLTIGLKPTDADLMELKDPLGPLTWMDGHQMLITRDLLFDFYSFLIRAMLERDFEQMANRTSLLQLRLVELAASLGIPFDKVFEEVHRSNMTKLKGGVIRRDDGKIQKGPHFEKPRIAEILNALR